MKYTKKVTFLSVFTALGLVLSYVETLLPTFVPIPGIKMGLANIVVIVILYKYGWKEAVIVNLLRIGIAAVLFGSVLSVLYSFTGATLSLIAMIILKKISKLSVITISVIGGVFHNIGQVLVAVIITSTIQIASYLPILLISGTISGIVIGMIGGLLFKKTEKITME